MRPYAQTAPSEPGEEAPIPIEGAVPSEPGPWPYALPFLADRVIKQGYSLPLPRGLSVVYTYIQRDIKISSVSLGVTLIGTVRSGWNGNVLDIPLRLWVGGSPGHQGHREGDRGGA